MPKLVALQKFTFDGRIFQKGDDVSASDSDAEVLVILGHVEHQAGLVHRTRSLSTGAEKQSGSGLRRPPPLITKSAA